MDLLDWLQHKENATLALALIGAVNGTMGLLISFLNRFDTVGTARRQQARQTPWATLRIEAGDHAGCMLRATVYNPSPLPIVITELRVEIPGNRQIVFMRPDPRDLLGPLLPDIRRGSAVVAVNWTVKAMAGMPEKPSFHEEFILAEHGWVPETRSRWRPAARMRQTTVALRLRGHTLSAAQDPIDLLVEATN